VIRGKRMGKPPEEVNREFRIAARSHVKGKKKLEKTVGYSMDNYQ